MNKKNHSKESDDLDLAETAETIKEKISEVSQNVSAYTKKHPLRVMGLSVLAGIVTARLLSRRKK